MKEKYNANINTTNKEAQTMFQESMMAFMGKSKKEKRWHKVEKKLRNFENTKVDFGNDKSSENPFDKSDSDSADNAEWVAGSVGKLGHLKIKDFNRLVT